MEYDFSRYRGARLINVIVTFLKEHGVKEPFPSIVPIHSKLLYVDDYIIISFFRIKSNQGFYQIFFKNNSDATIRTTRFYYIEDRRY